ncbi:AAA family ATPase [Methylobacterium sp. J-072]|uniref:AAA family ATPase n=1 Tax=Methylobacterium sp. J-072 TaxID=2836651 RepID=UPI001FBB53AF|nr:AAA family ATPase [Methylobacterium sp. J-072]MCJ2096329.1 AAA family ATPase [Methylobacterium sp. J-072]
MTLVTVEHILSEREFGVILATRVVGEDGDASGPELRVRALRRVMMGAPAVGERWTVEGPITKTKWGPQLEARRAVRQLPSGALVRSFLASHVPGIGQDRADRLWKAYGTDLPEVLLKGDLAEIGAVLAPERPLLGPRIAAAAVRAWRDAEAEAKLVVWLQGCGVDDMRVAMRISAALGETAVDTLGRNPWCLISLLPWPKVDALGCRLLREAGIRTVEDVPDRLVGAVDAVMKAVIASGDTMIGDADLQLALAIALDVAVDHPRVGAAVSAGARNGAVRAGEADTWRAPGCALMEEAVVSRFLDIHALGHIAKRPDRSAENRVALANYEGSAGILHPEQRAAVLQVLACPFACLRGGAGVGKTHVTRAICHVWEATGGDVVLAALAGKAALRLSRSTGRLARTLFRTIRELDERARIADALLEGVERGEELKLTARLETLAEITPQSLVIVDEASMVDIATMHALLRRMPAGARLLLVGDERQLPPVGFGIVFHRIIADERITASLTVIHRQTDDSGIPLVAAAVRERRLPVLKPYAGLQDGVSLIPATDLESIRDEVLRAYQDLAAEDLLVIAPTKSGITGVPALNEELHELFVDANQSSEMVSPLGERFSIGEPILHGRNDYARGLFNGSMGTVVSLDGDVMTTDFDGEEHQFKRDELLDLSLGYALTCHRAQGSQAKRVIIALTPCQLLDPSWLYTALTRAERQVVIVGDPKVIGLTLDMPWAAEQRLVGFEWDRPMPATAATELNGSP